MDFSYQGCHPSQLATLAAHTHTIQEVEQPWYLDSGANNHVTSTLENLTLDQQPYPKNDQVRVGNGGGFLINNTSSSLLSTLNSTFLLQNIIHCPHASLNLLSIQCFCQDNSCYFVLTTFSFVVKDIQTKETLLQGL